MRDADIFDRLMAAKPFRWAEPFYKQHKEALLYLLFGGLTTLVSLLSFWVINGVLCVNEHIANTVSWILAVAFAFFTNRVWVFDAPTKTAGAFIRQMLVFYGGRLFSFGVEEVILFVGITWLHGPAMPIKIAAQVIVIALNYVLSKWLIFKKK